MNYLCIAKWILLTFYILMIIFCTSNQNHMMKANMHHITFWSSFYFVFLKDNDTHEIVLLWNVVHLIILWAMSISCLHALTYNNQLNYWSKWLRRKAYTLFSGVIASVSYFHFLLWYYPLRDSDNGHLKDLLNELMVLYCLSQQEVKS